MSAREALRDVVRGRRPAGGLLLQTCRMEAFGADFYGEEAILEAFRARPDSAAVADGDDAIACPAHLAVFGADYALFADIYDGHLARIWRIGPGDPIASEPVLQVPFDPDLAQVRGDVLLRAEDHPFMPPALTRSLRVWAQGEVTNGIGDGTLRARLFLLRAFADGERGAALFAIHRLGPGPIRTAGFSYAAARLRSSGEDLVDVQLIAEPRDAREPGAAAWRARL